MDYGLLKFVHILGAVLMGGGLIGVWMSDLRSRQLHELKSFSEAVRNIAVFYDGRPRRSTAAIFRHLDDSELLRRVELLAIPLAGGNGRPIRVRVYRGQYGHPPLFYATAPSDQISA